MLCTVGLLSDNDKGHAIIFIKFRVEYFAYVRVELIFRLSESKEFLVISENLINYFY